ncbi:MAG: hypothetical protein ACTSRS_13255 [Candidatus Helarchaeota archaeon]
MSRNNDKNSIDLTDFIDSISIDVYDTYIKRHFLTPLQLKIKGALILEKLPLFRYTDGPRSSRWEKRIDEELEIFEFLKEKYVQQVGFPVYDQLKPIADNKRIWNAVFRMKKRNRGKKIEIRLDLRYPFKFPRARRELTEQHVSLGDKCFGELTRRWRADGKFGIPHFLVILSYYYALEHTSLKI